jgi:ABC-2 type transport system permease protein
MKSKKTQDILRYSLFVAILLVLNVVGSLKFFRLDLTSDQRYSLSEATVALLEKVDDPLLFKVYLKGDFPAGFQRLQNETRLMLEEFRAYNPNIQYQFVDPNEAETEKQAEKIKKQLQSRGIRPYQLSMRKKDGSATQTIFPGALVSYGNEETSLALLESKLGAPPAQQINASIQNLEFALANTVRALVVKDKPLIGFIQGHGELDPREMASFARALSKNYNVSLFNLRKFSSDTSQQSWSVARQQQRLNRFDAIVIAKPRRAFNKLDKFLLDQYVMNGGRSLWLLDAVTASMDSLSVQSQFISLPLLPRLQLNDLLFKYGFRLNTDLVADQTAAAINDQRQILPWIYFPLVMPRVKHPITQNLNALKLQFASSLDTVQSPGARSRILLRSSAQSKIFPAPHLVSLRDLYERPPRERFRANGIPLAVMSEGRFSSLFKNRIAPREEGSPLQVKGESDSTQILVVGDGDIVRNQFNVLNPNIPKGAPLPLGYDQYTGKQFGNEDFLINALDYMLDDRGLISIRSRELKIRLLDGNQIAEQRLLWQILNTALPVFLVICFGLGYRYYRKFKYAS